MAIEKMTYFNISGPQDTLDQVLRCVMNFQGFHPEHAAKLSEYSIGTPALEKNPYTAVVGEGDALFSAFSLTLQPFDDPNGKKIEQKSIAEAEDAYKEFRTQYPPLTHQILELQEQQEQQEERKQQKQKKQTPANDSLEDTLVKLMEQQQALLANVSVHYRGMQYGYDTYTLRKYAVIIKGQFHLVGFAKTKRSQELLAQLEDIAAVVVNAQPAEKSPRFPVPVELKNNWFTRPFEMFVTMYGTPSYNDIDPTPFVAFSYTLLFGLMFGDLGQGLLLALIGWILWKKRGMVLGQIMSRIGLSAGFFGFWYGSVFGYEHLLDPVFHAMGFSEKPLEIMSPTTTTTVLLSAIGLGILLIVLSMTFNVVTSFRKRDYERAILSNNGLAGLLFYLAILIGILLSVTGRQVFDSAYVIFFIVVPILLMFFKEPIAKFVALKVRGVSMQSRLEQSHAPKQPYIPSEVISLFRAEYITVRFGRLPIESYRKLDFYKEEPFLIYPLQTDTQYIWAVYACATADEKEIDAVFSDLFFEMIPIPLESTVSEAECNRFIQTTIQPPDTRSEERESYRPKSTLEILFPEGIGGFITQNIFEMFEILLSFVTNTMSFLRVGGFALVHAGMMSVVFTLAGMMGTVGSAVVIMIGNLFVMGLEGLIVGIQTLRLEFYEMFSRFFDAEGIAFSPVVFQKKPV